MKKYLYVDAHNVNVGGAKVLLEIFVRSVLENTSLHMVILLDERNESDFSSERVLVNSTRFGFVSRLTFFAGKSNVLFFGNFPPFSKVNNSICYVHNRYLVDSFAELYLTQSFKTLFKVQLSRFVLKAFARNCDVIACQTPTMKEKLGLFLGREISQFPFYEEISESAEAIEVFYDLCYIGLPSKHKNHERLISALEEMSDRQVEISIALTVPAIPENDLILNRLEKLNRIGVVSVKNFGLISHDEVLEIYKSSRALIFPSLKETYGLPLVEAAELGLPILASNLDYVADVVSGFYAFNPKSVKSIQNVIMDFLGDPSPVKPTLVTKNSLSELVDYFAASQ